MRTESVLHACDFVNRTLNGPKLREGAACQYFVDSNTNTVVEFYALFLNVFVIINCLLKIYVILK